MSDLREVGYELFKNWSASIEAFNNRPGGEYSSRIKTGSGTRLSPTDGKLEYTYAEAQLHHSGKILATVRIDVNYENGTLSITHADRTAESILATGIDVSGLADRIISELTSGEVGRK